MLYISKIQALGECSYFRSQKEKGVKELVKTVLNMSNFKKFEH